MRALKCLLPRQVVASPVKTSNCNNTKCLMCMALMYGNGQLFKWSTYGHNIKLDQVLQASNISWNAVAFKRRNTVIYNSIKFTGHCTIPLCYEQPMSQPLCVCKSCHRNTTANFIQCLVCSHTVPGKGIDPGALVGSRSVNHQPPDHSVGDQMIEHSHTGDREINMANNLCALQKHTQDNCVVGTLAVPMNKALSPTPSNGESECEQTEISQTIPCSDEGSDIGECNDDQELVEDQEEINKCQDTTGDPLPSVVQFDSLENVVFNCAPGENNIPKYILLDEQFEELAFPDLFPYGSIRYNSRHMEYHLPIRKYFQQWLLNANDHFAKNIEYIFCVRYISDIQQIQSDANLAICLSRGRTLNGEKITVGLLHDPGVLQQLICMEQVYKFLKNVRGSPAYWQSELYDVLAILRSLGIPTFFLTLSPVDVHWPEMIQAIAAQYDIKIPTEAVNNMSVADKSWFLHQNPVKSPWVND